jgi:hypothetical protein
MPTPADQGTLEEILAKDGGLLSNDTRLILEIRTAILARHWSPAPTKDFVGLACPDGTLSAPFQPDRGASHFRMIRAFKIDRNDFVQVNNRCNLTPIIHRSIHRPASLGLGTPRPLSREPDRRGTTADFDGF